MLKEIFANLLSNYTADNNLINTLWAEIEQNYSDKNRYYHNLSHLDNLYRELFQVKEKITNWETVLFTLYYHDIIYSSLNFDNEEKSAQLAEKRLKQINVPIEIIEECKLQILATKSHSENSNIDTKYFLDADLSILGQNTETYLVYYQNIRKEYALYPNLIYNSGRKKVLKHFLNMERIFKTQFFYDKFEANVKLNLDTELNNLTN